MTTKSLAWALGLGALLFLMTRRAKAAQIEEIKVWQGGMEEWMPINTPISKDKNPFFMLKAKNNSQIDIALEDVIIVVNIAGQSVGFVTGRLPAGESDWFRSGTVEKIKFAGQYEAVFELYFSSVLVDRKTEVITVE